ncbi:ras guanine nucleotide exchange factor domain-containing protein, partial [Lactarius hatsudake]
LRKAFSVDSFSRPSRHSPVSATSRQRGFQSLESPQVSYVPRDPSFHFPGRSRGASVSTTGDETSSSIPEESNSDVMRDIPIGAKRTKIRGKLRPTLPPGELPLPSKLLVTHPATPPIASSSNDTTPRLPAATIEDLLHRKSKAGPSNRPSRGDLTGFGSTNNGIGTNFGSTMLQSVSRTLLVTVAVIGAKGCGKSTAISRGLRAYKLTEPVVVPDGTEDEPPHQYTLREGKVINEHGAVAVLNVLEVDAAILKARLESNRAMWPEQSPLLDGVILCCDVSKKDSFAEVEDVLPAFREARLPIVALACRCDLENLLDLKWVHERLSTFDIGLVKVTISNEAGKNRLRLAFEWLLGAVNPNRHHLDVINYQNPASPEVLTATPPWEIQRSDTATPTAAMNGSSEVPQVPSSYDAHTDIHSTSSIHTRSMGDLLASNAEATTKGVPEHDKSQDVADREAKSSVSAVSLLAIVPGAELSGLADGVEAYRRYARRSSRRYVPWATLDELLDRLLFLAISDDDWGFISHFLLTYRRFANPRSLILAMQKRMRQLDQSSDDPMFACFAQMRICHLLEVWIQDYPHDFVVGAAADALNALIKSIITKTHLLHYGSDLLPFLEARPLHDKDSVWAMKVDEPIVENDDFDDDDNDDDDVVPVIESTSTQTQLSEEARSTRPQLPSFSAERKPSLISARSNGTSATDQADSVKEVLKNLLITSAKLGNCEPLHVAEENHKSWKTPPRDWLHHVLVSGKKDPETNSIARFNEMSEHLADWVVSLILCHDKPKNRAKQIEKLVEIAEKLRALNNYSALRAFVAGINSATYPGDPAIAKFQENNPKLHKHLQSWELLFNSTGSHRTYRMALRNSKGPCIPALEVHLSDLIRAHVGNGDFHPEDPSKIHWAKFNMMGRFVHLVKKYQLRCRSVEDGYSFEERPELQGILNVTIMHNEVSPYISYLGDDNLPGFMKMQLSRIAPPPDGEESRDYSDRRDAALIRKLMFWV